MGTCTLDLECRCGGRVRVTLGYPSDLRKEREAFDEAHAVCREREPDPGLCWHDSGIEWPDGFRPRCELRSGHAGAHECNHGPLGGTAVWTEPGWVDEPPATPHPPRRPESSAVSDRDAGREENTE